jgi:hypothetical protein
MRSPYDVGEMNVLARMKRIMIEKHGYAPKDFEGYNFTEIESMFLDDCGEPDFRPAEDSQPQIG